MSFNSAQYYDLPSYYVDETYDDQLMGSFYNMDNVLGSPNTGNIDELPNEKETEDFLRKSLKTPIPDEVPFTLRALGDHNPIKDPRTPMHDLIKFAIWQSPRKRLTLGQIYDAIGDRWPILNAAEDKPWQRSIRHSLSLKAMFVQIPRPSREPGKGNYWVIDIRNGTGDSRARVRRQGASSSQGTSSTGQMDIFYDEFIVDDQEVFLHPPESSIFYDSQADNNFLVSPQDVSALWYTDYPSDYTMPQ